jgi:hypothetical protein
MTKGTIVGGTIGALLGGLAGLFVGEGIKRKAGADMAPELLTILGAGVGGVLVSSIAWAATTAPAAGAPTAAQTSSAQGTVPVFVPGA